MKKPGEKHTADRPGHPRPAVAGVGAAPTVAVAVFGKHPAWRDFISLNPANDAFLTQLYESIYRPCLNLIQSGQWGSDMTRVVPRIHHNVVHLAPSGEAAIGFLLGSRDQLGRQQPLFIVANAGSLNYHRAVACLMPLIDNLAHQLAGLGDQEAVMNLVQRSQISLPVQLEASSVPPSTHATRQLQFLLEVPEFAPAEDGLERLVYQLVGPDGPALTQAWETPAGLEDHLPTHIRVPVDSDHPVDDMDRWLTLARLLCGRRPALTLTAPAGKPWADLIVGIPAETELATICRLPEQELPIDDPDDDEDMPAEILSNPEPYTHAIPFTLDDGFRATVASLRTLCQQPPLEPLGPASAEGHRLADMQTTLTEVRQRVLASEKWRFWRAWPPRWLWIVAAAIGFLLLAVLVSKLLSHSAEPPPAAATPAAGTVVSARTVEEWRNLCTAFYDWFSMLEEHVLENAERQERWARDSDLEQVVELLNHDVKRHALDPRIISGQEGAPLKDLLDAPPPTLKDPTTQRAVSQALQNVQQAQAILTGRDWAAFQRLRQLASQTYPERDWQQAAARVTPVLDGLSLSPGLAAAVDHILSVSRHADDLEQTWAQLQAAGERLAATDSRVLGTVSTAVAARAGQALEQAVEDSLEAAPLIAHINQRLQPFVVVLDELRAFVDEAWPRVDPRRFLPHEERLFGRDPAATQPVELYRQWLEEARSFVLPDPNDWLAAIRADDTVCDSAVLNGMWRERRDDAIDNVRQNTLSGIPYFDLKARLEALRDLAKDLDGSTHLAPAFSGELPTEKPWRHRLVRHARELRDDALESLYKRAVTHDAAPLSLNHLQGTDDWNRIVTAYAGNVERCRKAMHDFGRIDRAIDMWKGLSAANADGRPPLIAVAQRWSRPDAFTGDSGLAAILDPIRKVTDCLLALAECQRPAEVTRILRDKGTPGHPLVLYRGWLALGRVSGGRWPSSPAEEELEDAWSDAVAAAARSLPDSPRRNRLLERIQTERVARQVVVLSRRVSECDDPVLARIQEWEAPLEPTDENLGERLRALETRRQLTTDVLAYVRSPTFTEKTDLNLLKRASVAWNGKLATVSADTYRTWLKRAGEYRYLDPDPRGKKHDSDTLVRSAGNTASGLVLLARQETPPPKEHIDKLDRALENLRRTDARLWELPAVEKHRDAITGALSDRAGALDAFVTQVEAVRAAVTPPPAWLATTAKTRLNGSSPALNAAFSERLKTAIGALDAEHLLHHPEQYARARDEAKQLERTFRELAGHIDDAFPAPADIGASTKGGRWHMPLLRAFEERREQVVRQLLSSAADLDACRTLHTTAAWKDRSQAFAAEIEAAPGLLDCLVDVNHLYHHPENALDLTAVRSLLGRFSAHRSSPLLEDAHPACAVLGAAATRAENLRQVMLRSDRRELLDVLKRDDGAAFIPILAWRRLVETDNGTWPKTVDELRLDIAAAQCVLSPVGLGAATRRAIRREALLRWRRALSRVRGEASITAAVDLLAGLGVPAWDTLESLKRQADIEATLTPTEQYNLWLLQNRCRARMCAAPDAARTLAGKLAAEAGTWQSQGLAEAALSPLIEGLNAIADGTSLADDRDEIRMAGPARAGWAAQPTPGDPAAITFLKPVAQREWTLTFRRVGLASPPGAAAYVCTTEMPLGLFVDMLADAETLKQFSRVYADGPATPATLDSPPAGPRLWRLSSTPNGNLSIGLTGGWLPAFTTPSPGYYPKSMVPPPGPGPMTPVNRLTPAAAAFVAASLGCRLPLVDEWAAAKEFGGEITERPNLRDAEWQRLRDHVVGLRETSSHWPLPEAGSVAEGWTPAAPASSDALPPADGFVWFAPVGSPLTYRFSHIVGNVGELTASVRMEGLPCPCDADTLRDVLRQRAVSFSVLGGSAISSPPLSTTDAVPIDRHGRQRGYADVGLRLAFSAPPCPMAKDVHDLLARQHLIGMGR